MNDTNGDQSPQENTSRLALAASVALPLLLLILAGAFELFSEAWVEEPRYEALFSLHSYYSRHPCNKDYLKMTPALNDNKVVVRYEKMAHRSCYNKPRFFVYNGVSKTTREVKVELELLDQPIEDGQSHVYLVPEFNDWILNQESPDGYQFEVDNYRSRPSFLFFRGSAMRAPLSIYKNGKRIQIPALWEVNHYSNSNIVFLGWVMEQGQRAQSR